MTEDPDRLRIEINDVDSRLDKCVSADLADALLPDLHSVPGSSGYSGRLFQNARLRRQPLAPLFKIDHHILVKIIDRRAPRYNTGWCRPAVPEPETDIRRPDQTDFTAAVVIAHRVEADPHDGEIAEMQNRRNLDQWRRLKIVVVFIDIGRIKSNTIFILPLSVYRGGSYPAVSFPLAGHDGGADFGTLRDSDVEISVRDLRFARLGGKCTSFKGEIPEFIRPAGDGINRQIIDLPFYRKCVVGEIFDCQIGYSGGYCG